MQKLFSSTVKNTLVKNQTPVALADL